MSREMKDAPLARRARKDRQEVILGLLTQGSRIDVQTLARRFRVTTETVRRDLISLEEAGLARRVHGGAVAANNRPWSVPPVLERVKLMAPQKQRIGEVAAPLVPEAGLVILDAGTTVLELVRHVDTGALASFVSVGLPAAMELATKGIEDLHVLGGEVNRRTLAASGEWALRSLRELRADVAFLGTSGFSVDRGATTTSHVDAAIKRAMIDSARTRVLMSDSSKLATAYMDSFAELGDIDFLCTDAGADPELLDEFRAAGIQVLVG